MWSAPLFPFPFVHISFVYGCDQELIRRVDSHFTRSEHSQADKDILKATLGACISNYIKDDRLTTLARAATWLGNDETHYVRQHPDYTLKELKAFADAFITFIDADLAYEAALKLVTP